MDSTAVQLPFQQAEHSVGKQRCEQMVEAVRVTRGGMGQRILMLTHSTVELPSRSIVDEAEKPQLP